MMMWMKRGKNVGNVEGKDASNLGLDGKRILSERGDNSRKKYEEKR
jgi:hypothetical protein